MPGIAAPEGERNPGGAPRGTTGVLFVLLAAVYLLTGKGFSEIRDAEEYFLITSAMVEDGAVSVRYDLTSYTGDKTVAVEERDGQERFFLQYGLGYPLVMVPFYAVGKLVAGVLPDHARLNALRPFLTRISCSLALPIVSALSCCVLYWLLLELGIDYRLAVGSALICGLATYVWPYAKIGFYEPFLALCQVTAVWAAVRYRRQGRAPWSALAGFALGWGVVTRPSAVLLLPFLVAYLLYAAYQRGPAPQRWMAGLASFAAGGLPWLLIFVWYNTVRTGSALDAGYPPGSVATVLDPARVAVALYGNMLSSGRGLLLFSPILVLGLWGIGGFWRQHRAEAAFVYSLIIANYLFFATRGNWATIWPWGPRYIEPLTPLLIVPVAFAVGDLWGRTKGRRAIVTLVVVSAAVQVLAILVPYGSWLHKVRPVHGERGCVFDWQCNPLWGQIDTLTRVSFEPMSASDLTDAGGPMDVEAKGAFRETLDFWFVYAFRLGAPALLWALPCLALVATIALASRRLYGLLRGPPAQPAEE